MRTLMTCDSAFERLTAGPVELDSNAAVQLKEHLKSCDSCRDLAEALRPACNVLHESLPDEQRSGLPTVLSEDDAHVRQIMGQVRALPITRRSHLRWPSAIAGLGISACVLFFCLPWAGSTGVPHTPMDVNRTLASLHLSPACQLLDTSEHARGTGPDVFASKSCEDCHRETYTWKTVTFVCCTECHASGAMGSPTMADKTPLLLACGTCHN